MQALREILAMGFDIGNDILDGLDLFRVLVRNLHFILFFERHHEFDDVQRVSPQIFDKGGLGGHLVRANSQLFAHDFLHPSLNRCRHLHIPPATDSYMYSPPLTLKTWPVMYPAPVPARNTIISATSA